MSGSHDKMPKSVWVQFGLAAIVMFLFFLWHKPHVSAEKFKDNMTKAESNLSPVGAVKVASANVGNAGPVDGKKTFDAACGFCHNTGAAGAPKVGDIAAWAERLAAGGVDGLYTNAINGKNAMPARGGNPALRDEDVQAAVDYILEKSK